MDLIQQARQASPVVDDDATTIDLPEPAAAQHLVARSWERGMATAEYAVGILAAVALALVLFNVFNDSAFFSSVLKVVTSIIGKVGGMLP